MALLYDIVYGVMFVFAIIGLVCCYSKLMDRL